MGFQAVQKKEETSFTDTLQNIAANVIDTGTTIAAGAMAVTGNIPGAIALSAGGDIVAGALHTSQDATMTAAKTAAGVTDIGVKGYIDWKKKQDEWTALYNLVGGKRAKKAAEATWSSTQSAEQASSKAVDEALSFLSVPTSQ